MIRRRSSVEKSGWVKFEPPLGRVSPSRQRAWFLVLCSLTGLMLALGCVLSYQWAPGLIPEAAFASGFCFAVLAWRLWGSM